MASAAILMGGLARRFGGRDKAALVIGGRTILERQIEALAPVVSEILLVRPAKAGYHDSHAGLVEAGHHDTHSGRPTRFIYDRVPDSGPLGGIDAALAAAHDDPTIVIACDMPFVTTPLLSYLLQASADADVVVPRTERGYHPLCAVYRKTCAEEVVRRLASRQLAVAGLFDAVRVRAVGSEELERFGPGDHLLANVNTAADLAVAERLQSHKP